MKQSLLVRPLSNVLTGCVNDVASTIRTSQVCPSLILCLALELLLFNNDRGGAGAEVADAMNRGW